MKRRAIERQPIDSKAKESASRPGTLEWRRGKPRLRLSLGSFGRRMLTLETCRTQEEAEERRALLCRLAERLVAAGQAAIGFPLLETAAKRDGRALDAVVAAIDKLARGDARPRSSGEMTICALAKRWTSGELAKEHPDHVRTKKTAADDARLFDRYVNPLVGELPVSSFTLDHAQRIMADVPAEHAPATRRHVAQAIHKLFAYAVFPLRLVPSSPLPRGWLPRIGPAKAKAYLYPDEERRLLALRSAPVAVRLLYGFLAREGMRSWSEAARLEWSDVDLERGVLSLDTNKTDDPRAWALRPDVVRALKVWRAMRPEDDPLVFGPDVSEPKPAERFRERLKSAGIDRPQLYEHTAERLRIRVHDLRATFITIGLANGRTEAWIADRTGHKSSLMINRYKRAARTAAEINLGDLAPLDTAIPELAAAAPKDEPGADKAPSEDARGKVPVHEPEPGTVVVRAARAAARRSQKAGKRSGSRRAEAAGCHLKSVAREGVSVRVRPGLPSEDQRGFGAGPRRASEAPERGPYQIRTSGAPERAPAPIPAPPAVTGRAATIGRLAAELASLTAAGDLDGARAVQETIARLLARPAPPTTRRAPP